MPDLPCAELEQLSREELESLCLCALSAAANMNLSGKKIKQVQRKMHELGISPEAKED